MKSSKLNVRDNCVQKKCTKDCAVAHAQKIRLMAHEIAQRTTFIEIVVYYVQMAL